VATVSGAGQLLRVTGWRDTWKPRGTRIVTRRRFGRGAGVLDLGFAGAVAAVVVDFRAAEPGDFDPSPQAENPTAAAAASTVTRARR
jgi:hypothetical protein